MKTFGETVVTVVKACGSVFLALRSELDMDCEESGSYGFCCSQDAGVGI